MVMPPEFVPDAPVERESDPLEPASLLPVENSTLPVFPVLDVADFITTEPLGPESLLPEITFISPPFFDALPACINKLPPLMDDKPTCKTISPADLLASPV